HMRNQRLREQEDRLHVDCEDAIEFVLLDLEHRPVAMGSAGIVDDRFAAAAFSSSPSRSRQATRAPSRAKVSAIPRPNPWPAPVTMADLPLRRILPPSDRSL